MATIKKLESKLKKGVELGIDLPFNTGTWDYDINERVDEEECEDVSDRLKTNCTRKDDNFDVTITLTKPRVQALDISINFNPSEISCGVYQMYCLPGNIAINGLSKFINSAEKPEEFFAEVLESILDNVKYHEKIAMLVVSNNDAKYSSIINGILDNISLSKSKWILNPNSGNKIKTWIL